MNFFSSYHIVSIASGFLSVDGVFGCLSFFYIRCFLQMSDDPLFFKKNIFIFETERRGRGGAERGRQRIPNRLRAIRAEPDVGPKLTNCETMS